MQYIVLGANGFIGRNIFNALKKKNRKVLGLNRKQFDLSDSNTYSKFDFSNSTILDAIVSVDDDEEKIYKTNLESMKSFITYLKKNCTSFNYIYLSTVSTQVEEQVSKSAYVRSKCLAENYIIDSLDKYKIIRLIFPFGKDENANRLISRLIGKIKTGDSVSLDNIFLNLTPIEYLSENIDTLLNCDEVEINFTDNIVYELRLIVEYMYKLLGKKCTYDFNVNNVIKLTTKCNLKLTDTKDIKTYLKKMITTNSKTKL